MTAAAYFVLLLPALAGTGQPVPPPTREPDELLLQKLGVDSEAETLLTFARLRVEPPTPSEIRAAIQAVLTGEPKERSAAQVRLLAAGPAALPYLQRAA